MTREEALEVMWKNLPSDKSLPVYEALQTLIPELRPKFKVGDIIEHNFCKRYSIWYEPDPFIVSIDENGYNLKDGGFIGFADQDEYTLVGRFNPNPTDMDDMDKECIGICKLLNSLPTIQTFESCSGHLKDRFSVWFFCDSIEVLSRLGRAVEHNYSDGKWEVVLDSTDTHPYGVFWLRSKSPFQNYEEMNESLQSLIANIRHWFKDEFDSYFIKPEDTTPVRFEEEDGEKHPVVDYKLMEQKPVEIDEEINRWMGCEAFPEGTSITPLPQAMEIVERTAKHFFELGEKTVPSPGGYWEGFNAGVRECQAKIRDVKGAMKEHKPINQCNTHEPTLDEARKWNEAYEKGYSLGYENGRNEQKSVEYSEEDERIRKKLIEYFNHYSEDREWWEGITPRDIVAYLERQKVEEEDGEKYPVADYKLMERKPAKLSVEDKQLVLKDISARLPYGVIYHRNDGANIELREVDIKNGTLNYTDNIVMRECKPYLRPMSSMTEEEKNEYFGRTMTIDIVETSQQVIDWLNAHHFDYNGLIEKGLALEAPEGMYKQ